MSINPVLVRNAALGTIYPSLTEVGEVIILHRDNISFKSTTPDNVTTFSASDGRLYLTNKRLIFISKGKTNRPDFTSFEAPLDLITVYEFKQPIFGCNYLYTEVSPKRGARNCIPVNAQIKWSFKQGGCQKFLKIFFRFMIDISNRRPIPSQIIENLNSGDMSYIAFIDPSDSSVIYTVQAQPKPQDNN
eukprot:GHVL01032932.1.p1 GENE.GHVL01032932.1~~GHVL01032932.1.p1  ORF type:complete len:189 (+),score=31.19 GHVL01032932.1:30-596(+)